MSRHRFASIVEPIADRPSFLARPMFGCVGCYLEGRLMLVLADRRPPWLGLLLPVERAVHAALRRDLPALRVHPVLGKWLYLPGQSAAFGENAAEIVERIGVGDRRFGVEPERKRLPRPRTIDRRPTRF